VDRDETLRPTEALDADEIGNDDERRRAAGLPLAADQIADEPDGESLDEIIELAKQWERRHAAKKQAMKELRAQVPKGTKSQMLQESIVIEGESSLDIGYSIAWRIVDERGKDAGIFRWRMNDDSYGAVFEPTK